MLSYCCQSREGKTITFFFMRFFRVPGKEKAVRICDTFNPVLEIIRSLTNLYFSVNVCFFCYCDGEVLQLGLSFNARDSSFSFFFLSLFFPSHTHTHKICLLIQVN